MKQLHPIDTEERAGGFPGEIAGASLKLGNRELGEPSPVEDSPAKSPGPH